MDLRAVVAAPFKQAGAERLPEREFVVALSLDRDWFSPERASRVVEVATDRGLLAREGDDLRAAFDVRAVEIPEGFEPSADVLRERSVFETVLDALVEDGADRQAAVAAINERQAALGVTPAAAAVLVARRRGVDVGDAAERAITELGDDWEGAGGE